MTFVAADNIEWTDTMWQVWHIVTAKANGEVWTDDEIARACGAVPDDTDECDVLCRSGVLSAISALYLSGHLTTAFPNPGWRRA